MKLKLPFAFVVGASSIGLSILLTMMPTFGVRADTSNRSATIPIFHGYEELHREVVVTHVTCPSLLDQHVNYREALDLKTREIIDFSNEGMGEERGWNDDEFQRTRYQIAYEYAQNSEYFTAFENKKMVGSLGITAAVHNEALPLEKYLGVEIPGDKLAEFRAYRILSTRPNIVFSNLFPLALRQSFMLLGGKLRQYDEPVIFTYGTETSLRLYGMMGFKLRDDITKMDHPIRKWGHNWWVLAITPRAFEQLVRRATKKPVYIGGFNSEMTLHTDIWGDIFLLPGAVGFIEDSGVTQAAGLSQPKDLGYGIVADIGSEVIVYPDRNTYYHGIYYVSRLAKNADLGHGIWARAGTFIAFHPNGHLFRVGSLMYAVDVNGKHFKAGDHIKLTDDGRPF